MGGADGSLLLQVVVGLFGAGAVYGGIRADLKRINSDVTRLEHSVEAVHSRIDCCIHAHRRAGDPREHEHHRAGD